MTALRSVHAGSICLLRQMGLHAAFAAGHCMGNRRLRSALTEAVWRMKRWEPGWRGFAKWGVVIFDKHAGAVRKKKAVIACVRLLFIDLWRLNTGRATLAGLGFKTPPATPMEPAATAQP